MVKLSSYSNPYEEGKWEDRPWDFWTEEQKSQVIYDAYFTHALTSKQVRKYLNVSKAHMYSQFVVPALSAVGYYVAHRNGMVGFLSRRSPTHSLIGGVAFVAVTSLLWLNLSPFYARKQAEQENILDHLYHKVGTNIKVFNTNLIPRTRTSVDIDIQTRKVYNQRNGLFAGTLYPEDDAAPAIRQKNLTHVYASKKVYL